MGVKTVVFNGDHRVLKRARYRVQLTYSIQFDLSANTARHCSCTPIRPGCDQVRYVELDSISRSLQNAVIAVEDDGFYTHPGFDIERFSPPLSTTRTETASWRGASTITQQLAKNLFCDSSRNFHAESKGNGLHLAPRKIPRQGQDTRTVPQLCAMGRQYFRGAKAASQAYYKKSCFRLSLSEAVAAGRHAGDAQQAVPAQRQECFYPEAGRGDRQQSLQKAHARRFRVHGHRGIRPAQGFVRRLHGRGRTRTRPEAAPSRQSGPAGKPKRKHWF